MEGKSNTYHDEIIERYCSRAGRNVVLQVIERDSCNVVGEKLTTSYCCLLSHICERKSDCRHYSVSSTETPAHSKA